MMTKEEFEDAIVKITMKIQEKAPELSKYLIEMPYKYSDDTKTEITIESLKQYYDSLEEVLEKYELEQGSRIM
jgi:hypothetical protein